jgi:hypothetical protein
LKDAIKDLIHKRKLNKYKAHNRQGGKEMRTAQRPPSRKRPENSQVAKEKVEYVVEERTKICIYNFY